MSEQIRSTEQEVPLGLFTPSKERKGPSVDMAQVVGKQDILFVCLDTLRYDAAVEEEERGGTPVLNRYGSWEKCQAPGNFTYPSHHAMFAGFLPCRYDAKHVADRELLFFPKSIGLGNKVPDGAYGFSGSTIMEGLENDGYDTWCVGGVAFLTNVRILAGSFRDIFRKAIGILRFPVRSKTARKIKWIFC